MRTVLPLVLVLALVAGCVGLQDFSGDPASDAGPATDAGDALAVERSLLPDMKAALQRKWPDDTIYSVELVGTRWEVRLGDAGLPALRTVQTVARSKTVSGTCGDFQVWFAQESTDGGNTWGPVDYFSVGDKTDVPCP